AYFPAFARLVELRGVVVGQDGRWLADELKRQGIDDEEAAAALREHGLSSVEETSLVVLEGDGSLSVVPRAGSTFRRQRRVRFVKR
ncbi:MAG TPA: YetF domain-containing protein, partial [Candidatus Dormibacteraeota bacterium]|nr:YetF domain-containing protein [Candidatus Dormibacteraeota bacterium]